MADQVEVNLDASTSSSVSHNSSFSFDADVSGTSSLDTCETDSSTSSLVKSPLDVLHSPAPSELARKRKVASNPPTGAERRTSQTKGKSEPTSISPQERLKDIEDEPLTVSCGKLFCSACREPISLKKSVIKLHVDSSKHKSYKVKL